MLGISISVNDATFIEGIGLVCWAEEEQDDGSIEKFQLIVTNPTTLDEALEELQRVPKRVHINSPFEPSIIRALYQQSRYDIDRIIEELQSKSQTINEIVGLQKYALALRGYLEQELWYQRN